MKRLKLAIARVVLSAAAVCCTLPTVVYHASPVPHTMKVSWYGYEQHGRMMANGHRFDAMKLTAAHRTLPFGTKLVLKSKRGRQVVVEITDRGPWAKGRDLDISLAAAKALGIVDEGVSVVSYSVVKE